MKKLEIDLNMEKIPETIEYIRKELIKRKVHKKEMARTLLTTEDVLAKMMDNAPEGTKVWVSIGGFLGNVDIRLSAWGEAFDSSDIEENLLLGQGVEDEEANDVIRRMINKLYADNRLIISGKGTVTSITNDVVKLQIVGGKSRIKYNSKFEKHFIDEIDYPSVVLDTGINKPVYDKAGTGYPNMDQFQWMLFIDLTTGNFVGQKDVAVISPINDETNEILANRVYLSKFSKIKINGVKFPSGTYAYMTNCSVSPYLVYVLKKVMEYEGYTIKRNDLDQSPWNRLVIVSACKSGKIKNALPHWTVYKFIDELRKFFNASFVFDEIGKTVSIMATNEMLTNDTQSYECEDAFSVEYDEDGLDNLATSNIEYSFDDAANRDWREYTRP